MIAYAVRIMQNASNERQPFLPMAYAVPIAPMAYNVQRPIAPMASAAAAVPMASNVQRPIAPMASAAADVPIASDVQPTVSNAPAAAHPAPRAAPSQTITTEHLKLVHGDCVEGIGQLPASSVDLVIADPPYNIAVQGSAWDTVPDYLAWSAGWLKASIAALRPGGSLFLYGSPAKLWIDRLKLVAAELGLEYVQHISWVYKQGGDSRLTHMTSYSVRMEYLEWFVKPGGPPTSRQEGRIALGSAGPYVDADWWDIPRENSRSKERAYGPPHHPSMKPLRLCDRLVEGHSRPGEVVLVPFGGSGSECVSVLQAGRKLIAFETDGAYYELILRRMHGHGLLPSSLQPLGALGDGAAAAGDDEQQLMRNGRYTSGYMGVFKHGQKWVAKVMRDGAFRNIGIFATAKEAARAYRDVCASDPDDERPGNQVDEARAAKRAAKRAGEGLVRGGERRAERSEPPVQAEDTLNTALSSTLISSRTVARSSEEGSPFVGALGDVPSAPLFRAPMGPPMPWPAVADGRCHLEREVVATASAAAAATSATSAAAAATSATSAAAAATSATSAAAAAAATAATAAAAAAAAAAATAAAAAATAAATAAKASPNANDDLADTELAAASAEDLPVVICSADSEDDDEDIVISSLPNTVTSTSLDLPPSKRPCRRPAAASAAAAAPAAVAASVAVAPVVGPSFLGPSLLGPSVAVAPVVGHRIERRRGARQTTAGPNKEGPNKEGPIGVLPRRASPSCRASAAAATHEGAPARLGGPNKEGPDKEGPEGAPARLGERAAEALAAVRTKPPPGWTKVMDFGKLKGYRSRDGRKAMSLPAAWRLYDDEQ